jgi:EAL domain-containing protein (putative c-di-GMP-specific phosphodiesterase class I)
MHTNAVRRLEIEGKLRRAVAGSELFVNYQPIVSLADNTIIGFEALSRWSTREGMISPLEFMPIADETGLILPINRALLEEASQQMLRWQQQYPREQPLYLSINISPRQFSHPQLAAEISLTLQNAGLAPRSVRLEILETVAVQDLEMASRVITELKELGLRLSIDDFGTGYSSLSRLNCLPIDAIKIDSSLIWNMEKDEKSREIVKTIIMLAHTMKLDVVAEGIETPTHLELVREFGSDAAQGYLFSKPVSAEQVDLLLNSLRPVIDDASGVLTYA